MKFVFLFGFVDVKESNTRLEIIIPIITLYAFVLALACVGFDTIVVRFRR
jgi:hypothetical protein